MRPYAINDAPLTKYIVATATRAVVRSNKPQSLALMRSTRFGYGKCKLIIALLVDAGVITPTSKITGNRSVILKNEAAAVNAALRQLKKGRATKSE